MQYALCLQHVFFIAGSPIYRHFYILYNISATILSLVFQLLIMFLQYSTWFNITTSLIVWLIFIEICMTFVFVFILLLGITNLLRKPDLRTCVFLAAYPKLGHNVRINLDFVFCYFVIF